MSPVIQVRDLTKDFVLHTQNGVRIPVFSGLSLDVAAGECVGLHGPSGAGKSTLLRALYANYKPDSGAVIVSHDGGAVDMATAEPRAVLDVRRRTLGYVSQFLRVIPRVPALDVVAEPLVALGTPGDAAREKAAVLLARLNIPERLWHLAPATFSGGEQQRVNIARGFATDYPAMLLDEPTASLDAANRDTVVAMIQEAKARGCSIVGIFHDVDVRTRVCDRLFEIGARDHAA
ncbi:Phosphonates transport ATP-binding protein PhnL [Caenispirillum salinarum AK4]|uniref:Phosphonates transport ATP-binding protein PhnL n=1 Tax=Caenispirillum salinarum AK4 TaxID=1238182 RepID=K9H060_9PROT|nr:phosphonate C-P lyase system protein PhnL [Caenispirillum salinarum]EKV30932.1 Phosphonates transport ATP-binding protein PhnL [Caenispirillum salinarum AK4]